MIATISAEEQLRREISGLAVDDILALCYALQQRKQHLNRLRLYLDILRQRSGERAQFASSLICFDLARQGDISAQRDFTFLTDTLRITAKNTELVNQLTQGDPYLSYIWDLCRTQLDELDERFSDSIDDNAENEPVRTLSLLSDVDFTEELPDLDIDDATMRQRFERALETFLGGVPGYPIFDSESGFRMRTGHDIERIENFLHELESLRDFVKNARGYRALVLLFYGTHMRSRNLFGVINARKQELLRAGLIEFTQSGHLVADIAGVLTPLHADPSVWIKLTDIIQDYIGYCINDPEAAKNGPAGYDAVGRLIRREHGRSRERR
ncbi:MAG: hypothetical protein JW841_15175 [Deltaproteobacteria bacterium]|nr:hypothetical protein [Deltaproteobacteria bacterium]